MPGKKPRGHATKQCSSCNTQYPQTDSHFHKDAESPDGLKHQCKQCEAADRQHEFVQQVQERLDALDGATLKTLEQLGSLSQTTAVPHAATVFQHLVDIWGGSVGFAQRCMTEYLAAKPGSMIRQRYNMLIAKMALDTSKEGYVQPPLETLSDEDLEKLYLERKQDLKLRLISDDEQAISDAG